MRATPNMLHPTRLAIVEALSRGEERSPNELVEFTGASLGTVAYHVRALAAAGVIELSREARVRGAVEHFYRLSLPRREALAEQMRETRLAAGRAERALRR